MRMSRTRVFAVLALIHSLTIAPCLRMTASLARSVQGNAALLVQAVGIISITGGLWMVYEPLAPIVAGIGLVILGAGLAAEPPRSE